MLVDDKKEYLLQATIIEARHLKGKDSSGMSNPFVKLVSGSLPPQTSEVIYETLTPCWNQSFTFQGLMLNETDLQTSELTFEVYSKNNFLSNDLIGKFSVGLSTLYKNANHEYFNVWLVLSNPDDDPDETQGYLLINCFIIGPGDRPPVHDSNEKVNQDVADDDEEVDLDQMNFEQLRAYQEKKQGIIVLGKPGVARKSFQLSVYIFKCEHLINFGSILGGPKKPTAFISARAVGLVQKTKKVRDNNSPTINQKMLFPCYFPFLNDKILLRIWNENQGAADEFIANIPEFPMSNDFFNISKLISLGGRLPAKWINLYGIPPSERNQGLNLGGRKRHPKEGTAFMGRVMMSFSLLANERPLCATTPCNTFYEPDSQAYKLFCDIYEVKDLKESQYDITVWCDCRIGPHTTGDNKHCKPKKNRVYWEQKEKVNQITLPQISLENYAKDLSQVPDIFINLYTGGDGTGERIGYLRLSPEEVIKWEPIPRWLHFKPLDLSKDSPGSILCNLQFLIETENTRRVFKQRGILKKFVLHFFVVQGFELDPKNNEENIETFVDISLDTKSKMTKTEKGRFPFWNAYNKISDVELDFKLDFAPDVVVTVYKIVKSGLFKDKFENVEIGRFTVPIRSISKEGKIYPHYFNLIKSNEITGRVSGMFYIESQKKNPESKVIFPIKDELAYKSKADVKIFVLGIRNMEFELNIESVDFEVMLCLNNEQMKPHKISVELDKVNDKEMSSNILNVVEMFEFKDVEIYGRGEFKVFPYAKIMFRQKRLFFDDERFIFFNLSDYCSSVKDNIKKLHRLLFEQHLGLVSLDQEQRFIPDYEQVKEKQIDDEERVTKVDDEIALIKNDKVDKEINRDKIKEEVYDENGDRKLVKLMSEYKNMVISDEIALKCMNKHKEKEKAIKKRLRKKLVGELREFQKNELTNNEDVSRLLDLQEEVRRLKKPQMTEQMFYSFDDIADEYDYGRDIYKEDVYECSKDLEIPYSRKNLFYIPKSLFTDKFQTMGGYLKLGKESDCSIKFNVDVSLKDTLEVTKTTTTDRMQKYLDNQIDFENEEERRKLEDEVNKELLSYNIFNEIFLRKLKNLYLKKEERKKLINLKKDIVVPLSNVRVRVYVYRCLNLTAQDNNATVIDRLAGYAAFCKADAFLEISVGSSEGSADSSKGVKKIIDRSAYVPNSLSPEFYKFFELEADLPTDWKLTIKVMSRMEGSLTDTLIGSTEIDLEDRYLGEFRTRNLMKYKSLEAYYENYLRELGKKENEDNSGLNALINEKIKILNTKADDLKPMRIPVEYRPLTKPGTKTAQGIIEMLVEVFPQNIAKLMKPSKIEPPPPQEYELRLIIWETRNIPLGNKKAIDVGIKVMYDPEGWLSQEIRKETDTHLGVTDGRAVFNWRMKFPIKIPCTFPRLYFAVYDFNAFSSDDAIGQCYISLKRIFKKLLQEGRLTMDKKWIPLTSVDDPGEVKGEILYSIYLLQTYEADQNPVGEAQDEPNKDPKLERPKEGRGIGDFLKTMIDFSNWKFNFSLFGALKTMALIVFVLIIFVILFVAPGILVK